MKIIKNIVYNDTYLYVEGTDTESASKRSLYVQSLYVQFSTT